MGSTSPSQRLATNGRTSASLGLLIKAGHRPQEAADLAMLAICSLKGAIAMARAQRSTDPLDIVSFPRPAVAAGRSMSDHGLTWRLGRVSAVLG